MRVMGYDIKYLLMWGGKVVAQMVDTNFTLHLFYK